MTGPAIAADIRRFIMTSIPSVPYLEALLLLRGDVAAPWDGSRLARALYVSEPTAEGLLEALLAGGAVVPVSPVGQYRYQPASETLAAIIDALAEVHATRLVDVTNLIHAGTNRKAQRFADAFVWRNDKET